MGSGELRLGRTARKYENQTTVQNSETITTAFDPLVRRAESAP